MRSESPPLLRLGSVELAVLEHLWDVGESDVVRAHAALRAETSRNTIGSAFERLFKKGLVERVKVSHAYRYRSAIGREAFVARRVLEAVGGRRTLSDDRLLASLVDLVADSDAEALGTLERLVRAKRRAPRGGPPAEGPRR